MKKTFLILGVIAGISSANAIAAQVDTAWTKPSAATDGYSIAYTCPYGCSATSTGRTSHNRDEAGGTMAVKIVCTYNEGNGHKDGEYCGEPTVVELDYSIKSQQAAGAAKNIELSKEVNFTESLEVPASKLDRRPEKSHPKARAAIQVPKKIIYKEITFDDAPEELDDFGM